MKENPIMNLEQMEAIEREMKTLRLRTKLANLYHHQMEEFDNLKMEYAFMKTELLMIYQ
jgi:hypothetical protein